ncbi:MAG: hypothetical protein IT541_04170 [Hyphomicrobiales bacterium]|jgi:hypothetical protein|nr:hypothetical protein [Hyphomicrobiales bacterium]
MTKEGPSLTASDIALNVASVVLAFFSASFAGYMVLYGPPDGTNTITTVSVALEPFDTSRTKLGQYDTLDPIVTGSITKDDGAGRTADRAASELFESDQYLNYKLRSVVQNIALVDISNGRSVVTLPVEVGALIPGIGTVQRFERRGGRWIVVTTSSEISEAGTIPGR